MALFCQTASAQSSVTLYGLISTGIVYANNQKGADKQGHATWQFASGPMQTPRWGMKGVEDLAGPESHLHAGKRLQRGDWRTVARRP